jgi:AP-3 complex subunit mu
MIHSFYFISGTGEVIIEKHWRGVTVRSVCDFFWDEVNKYENKEVSKQGKARAMSLVKTVSR